MNLSIRTVKTEDAPALSDLFREFYKAESNVVKMKKQIDRILRNSDYYVPVVCDAERVVGTGMGILCHDLVGERTLC